MPNPSTPLDRELLRAAEFARSTEGMTIGDIDQTSQDLKMRITKSIGGQEITDELLRGVALGAWAMLGCAHHEDGRPVFEDTVTDYLRACSTAIGASVHEMRKGLADSAAFNVMMQGRAS